MQAIEKGAISIRGEKRKVAPNNAEMRAQILLQAHTGRNFPYSEELDRILGKLSRKKNKKIFYISNEELEKILGEDWELELFAGEMKKK